MSLYPRYFDKQIFCNEYYLDKWKAESFQRDTLLRALLF
jgi:hypothetical protein